MQDLHTLSATEAAALIRRRALSPREYVGAILARIERLQPTLNCFATVTAEAAMRAAVAAEEAVMRGDPLGPLHGVPVNVKDLFDTEGVVTAHGSAIFADHVPLRDNVLVARLKAAGAILVGKSTTPEFGHKGVTDSPRFGTTRNPWNPAYGAGGSSGGAACAVAAGLGPLGLGTDGAGSIRIPAATCGVVGHKPTLGLVPFEQTADAFANYGYAGPLTRTVADAAVMMDVIAGPAPGDPWTMHPVAPQRRPGLVHDRLDGLRIGAIGRAANLAVAPDVAEATRRMLDRLADLGAVIDEVPADLDWIEREGRVLYMGGQAAAYGGYEAQWGDRMDPSLRRFIAEGRTHSLIEYRHAQFARTRLFRAVQALFDRFDLLVSPTLPVAGLPADFRVGIDEIVIEGTRTNSTRIGWSSYVYPFNLTGHPALTVPSGFGREGVPLGLQLVGPWWSDSDLYRIGAMLERIAPWRAERPALD
jgi:aspartyl-tRNA(Asn)/glutamyl-tRNA(Gln) amidotransferase subunit A